MTDHIDEATRREMEKFNGVPISVPGDEEWRHFMREEDARRGREAEMQKTIRLECQEIADLLVRKNHDYGNSFAEPICIFSRLGAEEQLNVRIDDKLKRLANRETLTIAEDTEQDLIGYLILRRVLRRVSKSAHEKTK